MSERARYLKQQAELGGAEVVLGRSATEVTAMAKKNDREVVREAPNRPAQLEVTGKAPAIVIPPAPPATVAEVPQLQNTGVTKAAKRPAKEDAPSGRKPIAPAGSWLKNAPPVPGPGVSFDPPATYPELATLEAVADRISGCRACALCEGRTKTVPGEGNPKARFLVVGEGPGANEDETGRPFVGRAGDLLEDILAGIGLARDEVFILNTVKCRPPANRTPLPDELAACMPYLHRQIALIGPKVILAAGSTAIGALIQSKKALGQLRGQVHRYAGIPVVATYHPAALLRNPAWKHPTWDDVRIARQILDA